MMFLERPRQTKRDRAYYRHQASRVKHHRRQEATQVLQGYTPPNVGLASHHTLGCQKKGCALCKWEKQFHVPKPKERISESTNPLDYDVEAEPLVDSVS